MNNEQQNEESEFDYIDLDEIDEREEDYYEEPDLSDYYSYTVDNQVYFNGVKL